MSDRRSFLKGSALLAALVIVPAGLSAQEPQPTGRTPADPPKDAPPASGGKDGGTTPDEDRRAPDQDAPAPGTAKDGDGEKTFVGADGRPYRVCPQCGANMYKQARTWTCENCGYTYDE
jgi:ribosomal protein S27AE